MHTHATETSVFKSETDINMVKNKCILFFSRASPLNMGLYEKISGKLLPKWSISEYSTFRYEGKT